MSNQLQPESSESEIAAAAARLVAAFGAVEVIDRVDDARNAAGPRRGPAARARRAA